MLTGPPLFVAILTAIVFIVVSGTVLRWHPFFSLLLACLGLGLVVGIQPLKLMEIIREGFGGLLGSVGLLIVLGSVIGVALERSGGARRIADLLLGGGGTPGLRLTVLGAVVSVPVFCDSGYVILAGLLPALAERSGKPLAVLALSLAGGLYLTHTLMPPTPGPLAAAANLAADDHVGTIMLLAAVVCLPTVVVTWLAADRLGAGVVARPPGDLQSEAAGGGPLYLSLLPLALPVGLIACGTVVTFLAGDAALPAGVRLFFDPTVALLMGCLPAIGLLGSGGRSAAVGAALELAGPILIITGMGGAFGAVLKASPLAAEIGGMLAERTLGGYALLGLGFGVAALLKTAQGSSTGALVIASSILYPLLPLAGFSAPVELALLTLALGAGAMTVSHANDSYFWVVTRFAGIGVGDAYRSYSVLTGVMGITAFLAVLGCYAVYAMV